MERNRLHVRSRYVDQGLNSLISCGLGLRFEPARAYHLFQYLRLPFQLSDPFSTCDFIPVFGFLLQQPGLETSED